MGNIRNDLRECFLTLPGLDDAEARKAFIDFIPHKSLGRYLDWSGSRMEFTVRVIDEVTCRGQRFTADFLRSAGMEPQIGEEKATRLKDLATQIDKLTTDLWLKEFPTAPFVLQERPELTADLDRLASIVVSSKLLPYYGLGTDALMRQAGRPATQMAEAVAARVATAILDKRVTMAVFEEFTQKPTKTEWAFITFLRNLFELDGQLADDLAEQLTSGSQAGESAHVLSRLTTRIALEPFRKLVDILGRIPENTAEQFVRFYHISLPPTAHVLNNPVPSSLLTDLCDQPILKPWPPIFEFVERLRLADGIEPAISTELQEWVNANAEHVTPAVSVYAIELLRREVLANRESAGSQLASWLQVYLEPDWLNRTQDRKIPLFRVELVLSSPLTNGPLVLNSGQASEEASQLWTLDELPSLLDKAFANPEYLAKIPDITELVIEVVAPANVLLHGFDRWRRNGDTKKTYAMVHPMVVRLRDRLTIPYPADQMLADKHWRIKWKTFRDEVCRNLCEDIDWRTLQELDIFDLQDNQTMVALGCASPLLPDNHEVFDVIRDAGIPIAIWLRGLDLASIDQVDPKSLIRGVVHGKPLSNLYSVVREVRRSKPVRSDEKHFGNAITLLWDDPDRPPLKYEKQGIFV